MDLKQQVVVVTGASSGIGAAVALELAGEGARLALVARNQGRLSEVKERIRNLGGEAEYFICDVTKREQVKKTVAAILDRFQQIDMLIYSSGIGKPTFYRNFESQTIRNIYETNVLGLLDWLEFVLPGMQEKRRGTIVALSSLAAHLSTKRTAAYTSSKAALSNLLAGFRNGLKKYGIHVLTVEPGYVKTPMTRDNPNLVFPMDVEKAAHKIVKAIMRRKSIYRFPKILAVAVRLWECLPTGLQKLVVK